jgi:hypothetical protein
MTLVSAEQAKSNMMVSVRRVKIPNSPPHNTNAAQPESPMSANKVTPLCDPRNATQGGTGFLERSQLNQSIAN